MSPISPALTGDSVWPCLQWTLLALPSASCPGARGALGASTLQKPAIWPLSGASSCHLPGVPLSPLYHANFSRDNFSTMSPPARTETLYGACPREAAALPRQTKALWGLRTCLCLSGLLRRARCFQPAPREHLVRRLLALGQDINHGGARGRGRRGGLGRPAAGPGSQPYRPGSLAESEGSGVGRVGGGPSPKAEVLN